MEFKSKTFLTFEEAATKNWFVRPAESALERVIVEFADGTSYTYTTKSEIHSCDVAVISLNGKTGGEIGRVVSATNKGGGKSHLNPVQFTFATDPNAEQFKKMASSISDLSKESVMFKKFAQSTYHDAFAALIDKEIVYTLYAISILANPDLATPQIIKKVTEYLKRRKNLCPEFFGEKFNRVCVDDSHMKPASMHVHLAGYYHDWKKDWNTVSKNSKINSAKIRFSSEGYLKYKYGSKEAEDIIRNENEINEYYTKAVIRSALCVIIRGGFVNLLGAVIKAEIPLNEHIDMLCKLAKEIGSLPCLEVLNDYKKKS